MFKLKSRSHQADSFFVMLLFFLFALTAFILVLIGVKQYKSTANAMNYNYEVRTVTSYLREKVRQNDSDAAISVETINGTKAMQSNILDAIPTRLLSLTAGSFLSRKSKNLKLIFKLQGSICLSAF